MNIVIVLVNYFKEDELVSFVRNYLRMQEDCALQVFIVDNGSHSPDKLVGLAEEWPAVQLVDPGYNTGYIGAAALVMENLKGKGYMPDIFILSNFDLKMDQIHFFDRLSRVFSHSEAACVAPVIRSGRSGRSLNPYYIERIPISKVRRLITITSWYPLYFIYQWMHFIKSRFSKVANSERMDIYAPHGSFIALHRKYFDAGGDLKFGSFLYGEELFIAEMMRVRGLGVLFEPSLEMIHEEHTTTGVVKTPRHMKYLHQSLVYLYHTYFS